MNKSDNVDYEQKHIESQCLIDRWWSAHRRACSKKICWPELSHDPTATWLNHKCNLWLSSWLLQKISLYSHTQRQTSGKQSETDSQVTDKAKMCSLSVSLTMPRSPCQKHFSLDDFLGDLLWKLGGVTNNSTQTKQVKVWKHLFSV